MPGNEAENWIGSSAPWARGIAPGYRLGEGLLHLHLPFGLKSSRLERPGLGKMLPATERDRFALDSERSFLESERCAGDWEAPLLAGNASLSKLSASLLSVSRLSFSNIRAVPRCPNCRRRLGFFSALTLHGKRTVSCRGCATAIRLSQTVSNRGATITALASILLFQATVLVIRILSGHLPNGTVVFAFACVMIVAILFVGYFTVPLERAD